MFRGHSVIWTSRGRLEGNQRVPEAGWGQAINFSLKVQSCVVWKQELSEVGKGDLQAWGGWDSGQLRGADSKGPRGPGWGPPSVWRPRLWCRAQAKAEMAGRLDVPSRTGKSSWGPEWGECVIL